MKEKIEIYLHYESKIRIKVKKWIIVYNLWQVNNTFLIIRSFMGVIQVFCLKSGTRLSGNN